MTSTTPQTNWVPEDSFGGRLALIRQAMHWNVKEAAEECGLNDQSWRNWEAGGRCRDLIAVGEAIAGTTGIDLAWIVMGVVAQDASRSPWIATQGQMPLFDLAAA